MEPPLFVCREIKSLPLEEGGTAQAVTEGVNSGEETFV